MKKFVVNLVKHIICGKIVDKLRIKRNQKLLYKEGYDAINAYRSVGKIMGTEFIPMFGTLLGAYREHDFIPYDDDIDMGLDINYLSKELIQNLRNVGFEISNIYIASNYHGCQLPMKFHGIPCDIYFLYKESDEKYHTHLPLAISGRDWKYSASINIFRYKDITIPISDNSIHLQFGSTEIKVPSNTQEILSSIYGTDFMIPKRLAHADPPVIEIPIHDVFFNCYPIDFFLEESLYKELERKRL